jgi:hypothetical protein
MDLIWHVPRLEHGSVTSQQEKCHDPLQRAYMITNKKNIGIQVSGMFPFGVIDLTYYNRSHNMNTTITS